ncbi:MAG: DUF1080 domain-containing protein [Acidobacteria bacterium]|nr:DUF1080 domain-containing protein [Acidobacteriota bacterium]MDA1234841.1 DUF1080 domain-containing protein [Acidobacteriota bacterium]
MKLFMARYIFVFVLICVSLGAQEPGFTALFNGKNLQGWLLVHTANSGTGYLVEDGDIVCPSDGGGNLLTMAEYADFVLRLEFQTEPGGNSGVGIRAPLEGDIAYTGMEIQILDYDHSLYAGRLQPWQRHGSVYNVHPAEADALKPAGEWNQQEIRAEGDRITVTLNGQVITRADLSKVMDQEVLAKHPGVRRKTGRIGFLGHGSLVKFRNIRIREL